MTAEKLYELSCESLRIACVAACDNNESDGEALYNNVKKDPDMWLKNPYGVKYKPALKIWMSARDELGKAKHGSAYSAMKRIIASVPDTWKDLQGVWTDAEGRQCACDGCRAVRLKKPVEGFENVAGMNLGPVMKLEGECVMLDLPTPGELKACIAEQKGSGGKFYDFGGNLPRVNAKFLKDVLDIFPNAVAKSYGMNKPILFEDETGDAILLPVHKHTC